MSNKQYYYSRNGGNAIGPFDIAGLLEKIEHDDFVWCQGMDWTKASETPELAKFFKTQVVTQNQPSKPIPTPAEDSSKKIKQILSSLSILSKRVSTKGGFPYSKWANFAKHFPYSQKVTFDNCLVYYDDTLFGKGDDGFMITEDVFMWRNLLTEPQFLFLHPNAPGFVKDAELVRVTFISGNPNKLLVCNRASEKLFNGGFEVNLTFAESPEILAQKINELVLEIKKSKS